MRTIVALALIIIVAGCAQEQVAAPPLQTAHGTTPVPVEQEARPALTRDGIVTEDLQDIAFNSYLSDGPPVILLHMLGKDKSSWTDFSKDLQKAGYGTLAIDLRGHGESTGKWQSFSKEDFNAMTKDVAAAKKLLQFNRQKTKKLVLIGASLGANVALNYAAQDRDVAAVVLLSPGLDYKGVKTVEAAGKVRAPVLIVASRDDTYAFESSVELERLIRADFIQFAGAGHGTDMFKTTDLDERILKWLETKVT